jgi:hypothetical protein
MAAKLGLDSRVWQLCAGINKEKKRTVCFHNVITLFLAHNVQQSGIVANDREL